MNAALQFRVALARRRCSQANGCSFVTRPAMLPMGLEVPKRSRASSDLCSAFAITRNRVLFQRNPVGGRNQTLGRHKAGS